MLSQYYLSMINSYKKISEQVNGLSNYLDSCTTTIGRCRELVDETIIDNEPIDKGLLLCIMNSLNQLRTTIKTVVDECNLKVSEYNRLYCAALEKERTQLKTAKTNIVWGNLEIK